MQLFHVDSEKIHIKWNNLEVFPAPELISQLRRVLRVQKWDKIYIQYSDKNQTSRFELWILDWTDQKLLTEIISNRDFELDNNNTSMLIAMPNKREKAELIVQKLTEIWVKSIYFWVSEHSIIRQRNDKKSERLNKISHEAVEQSRWIQLPEIKFLELDDKIISFISWKNIILANQGWLPYTEITKEYNKNLCWVIWPEGWFSEKDLKIFKNAKIIDLWENVLRMETAAIVLWWILRNK